MRPSLDHFFISVAHENFERLKSIEVIKEIAEHKVVEAQGGDESWEGLYLFAENDLYFEIVKEDKEFTAGTIGFALSYMGKNGENELIKKQISLIDEEWTFLRRTRGDDTPWFDCWWLKDIKAGFFFWWMAYLGESGKKRVNGEHRKPITFESAQLKLNVKEFEKTLSLLEKYFDIEKSDNRAEFKFLLNGKTLNLCLCSDIKVSSVSFKYKNEVHKVKI